MKTLKTIVLSLIALTTFLAGMQCSYAKTVFFEFKHIAATIGKEPPLGEGILYVKAFNVDHKAESSHMVLDQSSQDHMSGDVLHSGEMNVLVSCTHHRMSTIKVFVLDIEEATKVISIKASCPIDDQGLPLHPADISVMQK
jgi:hypothetical protein